VLRHYAKIIRPKIKELFPESELDKTTIINGTIFVNEEQGKISIHYETVFEDVIKKFEKNGKLENIDPDFKSKLFESFLKESISRKN
jgi:type I restriction enzyme M protein